MKCAKASVGRGCWDEELGASSSCSSNPRACDLTSARVATKDNNVARKVVRDLLVDDNEDLNSFARLALQKLVEPPFLCDSGISSRPSNLNEGLTVARRRSSEVELRTQPPVVNAASDRASAAARRGREKDRLDLLLCQEDRSRQAPEVVPLRDLTHQLVPSSTTKERMHSINQPLRRNVKPDRRKRVEPVLAYSPNHQLHFLSPSDEEFSLANSPAQIVLDTMRSMLAMN